jgi:hypothetical protein
MKLHLRKPSARTLLLVAYAIAIVAIVAFILSACGASHRDRTIKATLASVNAVRDDFIAIDGRAQLAIVEAASTREEGAARLAIYREKRDIIVQGFVVVYKAIATAATTSGEPSVSAMLDAAKKLQAATEAVRKEIP